LAIILIDIIGSGTGWAIQNICDNNCSFPQTIPNLSAGNYTVKVLLMGADGNSCYAESMVAVGGSSNRNSRAVETAKLFPNPAADQIVLETVTLKGLEGTIQIYNTFGKLVRQISSTTFESDYKTLDLSGFENGMYFLSVQTKGKRLRTGRFVVENWK